MNEKWVEVRRRESQALIEQHNQKRAAEKAAWGQEFAAKQDAIKLAGGVAVRGEINVP